MADIEQLADEAAAIYVDSLDPDTTSDFYFDRARCEADFRAGYMAGVAQTQRDYTRHYLSRPSS